MAMASFAPPPGLTLSTPAAKPPPRLTPFPMAECEASNAEPLSNVTTQELPTLSDRSRSSSFDDNDIQQVVGDPSHVIFRDDESNPPLSRISSASSISPPNMSAFDEEADEPAAQEADAPAAEEDLGDLLSVGSKGHAEGSCTPCLFKLQGCIKGASCLYCHMEHVKKVRARPGKTTRNKYKNLVKMVEENFEADSDSKRMVMELLASESKYMRTILLAQATESETKVLASKNEALPVDAATAAALKEVLSIAHQKASVDSQQPYAPAMDLRSIKSASRGVIPRETNSRGQQGHDNAINHGAPYSWPQEAPTDPRHQAWCSSAWNTGTFYQGYDRLTTPLTWQSNNDEWVPSQIPLAVQSCWNDACVEGRPDLLHGPASYF